MLAKVRSSAIFGIDAYSCDVEVEIREGKQNFTIVGLGDSAVRESKERVVSAIRAAGFWVPKALLVNLAPAELKKEGSAFDLPIALAILIASRQLSLESQPTRSFHGELSLDGRVRGIRGVIALAAHARQNGDEQIVVPSENGAEAALVQGLEVITVGSLAELVAILRGTRPAKPATRALSIEPNSDNARSLHDVWGQELAKRALIIAAAGGHNALMIGPPGCGKSMLAERFPTLLPPLRDQEMLDVVKIHSLAGYPVTRLLGGERPYRAPHHSISDVAMVGGGSVVRPGEISLAHRGVLFLDEFPEFRRIVLESLRAPLESGVINIARARARVTLPARCQLIAAMNPCPCGRLGTSECRCSRAAVHHYLQKLSEPILDRIDLHVELDPVPLSVVTASTSKNTRSGEDIGILIAETQERQRKRSGKLNAELSGEELKKQVSFGRDAIVLLERASKRSALSVRGFVRMLRVAATVADLEGCATVNEKHLAEALSLRSLDKLRAFGEAAASNY